MYKYQTYVKNTLFQDTV